MLSKLTYFSLLPVKERHDIHIPGSPERCIHRTIIETSDNALWLLEQLTPSQQQRRERLGQLLHELSEQQVPYIPAFHTTPDGNFTQQDTDGVWQVSPFVHGIPLPQPEYVHDAWRGIAIANFITALQQAGAHISLPQKTTPPLPEYISQLSAVIQEREPIVFRRIMQVIPYLNDLFSLLDILPMTISHGDLHPINIIWGENSINGVIDWEFAGEKSTLYDAANCIGCCGFENPDSLVQGLVPALVTQLYATGVLTKQNARYLSHMVLALRFAWLSEWLRRSDHEMLEMELDYMDILVRYRDALPKAWKIV